MPSDEDRAKAVRKALRTLRSLQSEILRQGRALDARIAGIRDDPTVPDEGRAAVIQEERLRAAETLRGLMADAQRQHDSAERHIARWHRSFEVDPEAAATVRRLLDQGVAPGQIIEQAEAARDRPVIEAVLQQAPYLRAGDGRIGSPDAPAIVERAESALAGMSKYERGTVEAARALRGSEERLGAVLGFGRSVILGDPNAHAIARIGLGLTEERDEGADRVQEVPASALRGGG